MSSVNHAGRTAPLRRTPLAALVILTLGVTSVPATVLAEESTAEPHPEGVQVPPPPGPFQSFDQGHRFEQRGAMGARGMHGYYPPPGYDPEQRPQGREAMPQQPAMPSYQGGQHLPPQGYGYPMPPAGGMPVPPGYAPAYGHRPPPPGHAPHGGRPGHAGRPDHAGPPQHRPMPPHGQHPYARSPEHEAWMQQRQAEREAFLREQEAEREAFLRQQEERRRAWAAQRDERWGETAERRGMPDDFGQRPMAPPQGYGMPPYPGYPQQGWSPRGRD